MINIHVVLKYRGSEGWSRALLYDSPALHHLNFFDLLSRSKIDESEGSRNKRSKFPALSGNYNISHFLITNEEKLMLVEGYWQTTKPTTTFPFHFLRNYGTGYSMTSYWVPTVVTDVKGHAFYCVWVVCYYLKFKNILNPKFENLVFQFLTGIRYPVFGIQDILIFITTTHRTQHSSKNFEVQLSDLGLCKIRRSLSWEWKHDTISEWSSSKMI